MADRMSTEPLATVGRTDIVAGLKQMGLAANDVVIVHSSLSAFGKVTGGPAALVDAVLEVAGPKGTVVFPTFTGVDIDKISQDVTQLKPYTGAVPLVARDRGDFVVSRHPLYSICAKGPLAQELCELCDKYIFMSVEMKFIYRMGVYGGKVLLLGVTHKSNSAVHLVEEFSGVEYKVQDKAWWTLTVAEFTRLPQATQADMMDTHMGYKLPYRPIVHLDAIDAPMRKQGLIATAKIGNAQCHLMKIMDIVRVGAEESARDPWFLCDKIGKA